MRVKKIFLVDYENTGVRGLSGISELVEGDKIVIFCSSEVVMKALKDILKVYNEKFIEIKTYLLNKKANNALDFMITTYLGFELSKYDEKEIYILSADNGYKSAINMAKNLNQYIKVEFKECIYDCLHNEKDEVKGKIGIKEVAVSKDCIERISPTKGKELLLEKMNIENKIPSKHIQQIASLMYKHRDNKSEFERHTSRCLGTKNASYKKVAMEYYNEYKKLIC